MDWYLDAGNAASITALRHEAMDYLRRHAVEGSDLDAAELAVSELLSNVTRHAPGPAWASLEWGEAQPLLTVNDLGPGFNVDDVRTPDPLRQSGWGLFIASQVADQLEVARKRAGGARVRARLPVHRSGNGDGPTTLPSGRDAGLPAPEEADALGAFGRESFLRALVVQLGQVVEHGHGPAAAEAAVAQVGLAVGGHMEEAYREARGISDRLTPEQMGDLYVRLKAAIDGGFRVVEADPEKIVLTNTACPFGEVVKKSPSLCRMTSSVFGGIAARNTGGAAVQLEERIAVGDPGCRVVVWLGPEPPDLPYAHVYGAEPAGSA